MSMYAKLVLAGANQKKTTLSHLITSETTWIIGVHIFGISEDGQKRKSP